MLELIDLSLQVGRDDEEQTLLAEVTAKFPRRHFAAIIGPSGCGKSTLLKVIAGVREASIGQITWEGRDLAKDGDFDPHEIGYVPQFSIAFELLTVRENIENALSLRLAGLSEEEAEQRIERIVHDVGLEEIADRRVQLLSGGQRRRLALALEMVSSPHLLLADEVTSGLDPKSEDEIVHLLHTISRTEERIVLSVTHSLRHLALYDSVLVLYQGHTVYHGAPATLLHYFNVQHPDELYPRLSVREPGEWHRSWLKHREAYYEQLNLFESGRRKKAEPQPSENGDDAPATAAPMKTPSASAQFGVVLARRWKLFFRDRGQLALQLALLFGFPCLVVIFALDGLPQLKVLAESGGSFLQQLQSDAAVQADRMRTGSLVSGLIMFQVILLALMGSNNAAREIAGERLILEKEKFAGLRPSAYIAAKCSFLGALVLAQSVWMAVFVNFVVHFPGSLAEQIVQLTLVNAAMTAICLGLSAVMKTAEQASLVSIYLVGFQLPLSGAVLALPAAIQWITRPFIASFWGWSGFIQSLRETRYYEAVGNITHTALAPAALCLWVLLSHVVIGAFLAYTGCKSSRWE